MSEEGIYEVVTLGSLLDDTLLHCLKFLSNGDLCSCTEVCKRFYELSKNPCLWSTFNCTNFIVPPRYLHVPLSFLASFLMFA
jgi:hypothetical protein